MTPEYFGNYGHRQSEFPAEQKGLKANCRRVISMAIPRTLWLPIFAPLLVPMVPVRAETVLTAAGQSFAIDGEPRFLLGISYYAGLSASQEFLQRDLDDLKRFGFNWLRVWGTWDCFGENVSAVDSQGRAREIYLARLLTLVAECDRRKMVVDVTLARSRPAADNRVGVHLPDLDAHAHAVRTIIAALQPHRNWYLDLANERDIQDSRFVPIDELKQLRQLARELAPSMLVTASFGGHDLTRSDVVDVLQGFNGDFLAIHRPRHAGSAEETEQRTRQVLEILSSLPAGCPIHHQEPFRRGYADWQPSSADFLADLRGAIRGGAAGWCFHNGATRTTADQQPRRSFDLRDQRLVDQLDAEEKQVLAEVAGTLRVP